MKHRNVAFVLDSMAVGGVEKALIELLRAFDYSQYDVTLWLKDSCGPLQNQIDPRVKNRILGLHGHKRCFNAANQTQ